MAWTYADYEAQSTDALRLERLRSHIGEVSAAMQPNVASGGNSVDRDTLQPYLRDLQSRRAELEKSVGPAADSARLKGSFVRMRPV
jgi:hypothetical protein